MGNARKSVKKENKLIEYMNIEIKEMYQDLEKVTNESSIAVLSHAIRLREATVKELYQIQKSKEIPEHLHQYIDWSQQPPMFVISKIKDQKTLNEILNYVSKPFKFYDTRREINEKLGIK